MYGPNASDFWHSESQGFGRNLLRLLPQDDFDSQPLWSPDRSVCLVADVRLDNRDDLVRDLGLTQPETLSDSQVLLSAWVRWEESVLDHILGGFAFAIWNPARDTLFAARDHTGERPLYYSETTDFFAFASMPKGLLCLPGVHRELNQKHLIDSFVLARYAPGSTFYEGIHAVPQGHALRVTPHSVTCKPYWNPLQVKPIHFKRDEDYPAALLEIFDRATKARLRSTRGIASQLSAGLDSSSVTASAARLLAAQNKRLTSFTAVPRPGFQGKGLHGRIPDEGPAAAEIAALYPNLDHVLIDSAGIPLLESIQRLSAALDEPVQNGINTLWISAILNEVKRRDLGVLLVGNRGNATISYAGLEALTIKFRAGRWGDLLSTVLAMRRNGATSFRAALADSTMGLWPQPVNLWLRRAGGFQVNYTAARPELIAQHRLRDRMLNEFFDNSGDLDADRRDFLQRFDYGAYNAAYNALGGFDVRDPTADKRVFEFCYAIPREQYLVGGIDRSLVRRAMRDHRLPDSTITRTMRGQQGADWYLSVRDALPSLRAQAPTIEASPTAQRWLDLPRMRALLETFPADGHEALEATQSYGDALCRFFSFGTFLAKQDKS